MKHFLEDFPAPPTPREDLPLSLQHNVDVILALADWSRRMQDLNNAWLPPHRPSGTRKA